MSRIGQKILLAFGVLTFQAILAHLFDVGTAMAFMPLFFGLSDNTHSTDLELSSSQYWSITDASQTGLDLAGDMTFSMWLNLEQLPSTATTSFGLISKWGSGGSNRAYQILINTSDILRFTVSDDGTEAGHTTSCDSTSAIVVSGDVGNWVHIAVTWDASAGAAGVTLYKNGSSVSDTDGDSDATSCFTNSEPFIIGAVQTGEALYYDGLIDDVRVWSRVLSSAEVSSLYNNPCSFANGASLQGWWLFDNDGTDESGNSNDLTNNNSATFSTTVAYSCMATTTTTSTSSTTSSTSSTTSSNTSSSSTSSTTSSNTSSSSTSSTTSSNTSSSTTSSTTSSTSSTTSTSSSSTTSSTTSSSTSTSSSSTTSSSTTSSTSSTTSSTSSSTTSSTTSSSSSTTSSTSSSTTSSSTSSTTTKIEAYITPVVRLENFNPFMKLV